METSTWEQKFAQTKKIKLAKALTAFNSNVDYVVLGLHHAEKASSMLTHEEVSFAKKKVDAEPKEIKGMRDFYWALLHCVKTGKALHLPADSEVFEWLEKAFTPSEKRIGGQAGIMANQLSAFHDFVLTYSSLLSPFQAGFFDKNVCFPVLKGKKLICLQAKKAARVEHATKINWIFEFKANESLNFGGEVFTAPRSNRLIVSSLTHYLPVFSEHFNLQEVGKVVDVAFLAGFQQLHFDKNFNQTLEKIKKQIKLLKSKNEKLFVHWEYVPIDDKEIGRKVLKALGPSVDGMGLNEVELAEVLNLLGCSTEADRIKKNENSYTLYKGAKKLLDVLKLQRVHVHSFGFQILVLKNPYPIPLEKCRDSLIFSSIVAALKASKGTGFVTKTEVASHSLLPSASGLNQLRALEGGLDEERMKRHSSFERRALLESGVFELKDHYVICVPAPIVHSKSTVGLGDVITSTALAAERG
jgi:ADP-dependent phosphofructokinase/glucokinase